MGVFKEPQPRKKAPGAEEPKPFRTTPGTAEEFLLSQIDPKTPIRDSPSSLDVTVRKAALEAACRLQGNGTSNQFWANIVALEDYLRTGKTL